jgi:hypothetical protein
VLRLAPRFQPNFNFNFNFNQVQDDRRADRLGLRQEPRGKGHAAGGDEPRGGGGARPLRTPAREVRVVAGVVVVVVVVLVVVVVVVVVVVAESYVLCTYA